MNEIAFKYGQQTISCGLGDNAEILDFTEPDIDIDEQKFRSDFQTLIEGNSLSDNISIIVADKTRLCGYDMILPWVTDVLKEAGADPEKITFYIAYGTHAAQSEQECISAYGSVYKTYRFVHHDCSRKELFVSLGTTPRGTEVRVRKDIFDNALVITIGTISHHYFAGYGGARKLIFPGLAQKEAIYQNHRLFLDAQNHCLSKGCRPGNLEDNPLAEDLKDVHDLLPAYLSIHAILNSKGKPAKYSFGKSYEDFLEVCCELDTYYKHDVDKSYDMVLASTGGYPKDINMIQAHKAIHNGAALVRDGGTLIVFAECIDGIGSQTFLPYFEMGGWENTFSHLLDNYAGNGGTALAMMEKTRRISIKLVTELPEELCSSIGVAKISVEEARKMSRSHAGSLAVIENSSLLIS